MNSQPPVNANVNVIFHGLFLFVQQDHYIDVLIPNMGSSHVYRAGAFLGEETLAPRPLDQPYGLSGVAADSAKFDNTLNVVFANQDFKHSAGPDEVYARIVLPYPTEIRSLRPTRDAITPAIDPGGLVTVPKPAGVQVLRYFANDLGTVHLSPHPGRPAINGAGTFANLHIICEEDHVILDQARDGFYSILSLLPGITTPIIFGDLTTRFSLGADDIPRGFSRHELLELIERNERLLTPLGTALSDNPNGPLNIAPILADGPPFDCWALMCDHGNP